MKGISDHDVERLLTLRPAPAPPPGLARAIKAEIPERFGVAARVEVGSRRPDDHPGNNGKTAWMPALAAASLLLTAGLSAVAWLAVPPVPERRLHRLALVESEGARAGIEVVAAAEPTPVQEAARRAVAIEVRVVGPDERPRAGATVAVEPVAGGRAFALTTDRQGWATAAGLVPGTYRLRCAPGAHVSGADEVTLQAGERAALLLLLKASGEPAMPVGWTVPAGSHDRRARVG